MRRGPQPGRHPLLPAGPAKSYSGPAGAGAITIVLNRADIGFGKAFSCQLSLRQTTLAAQMSNDLAK